MKHLAMPKNHLLISNLLLLVSNTVIAFVSWNANVYSKKYTLLEAHEQSQASLRFKAAFNHTTKPVVLRNIKQPHQVKNLLIEFFELEDKRNHLLRGSGNIEVYKPKEHVISSFFEGLVRRWALECSVFDEDIASSQYDVSFLDLVVQTKFLLFTIFVKAILGFKLIYTPFANGNDNEKCNWEPEYEFVLLAEDFKGDGPPPLLFIFNQLTGKGQESSPYAFLNERHPHHAYLKVNAKLDKDDITGEEKVTFHSVSKAEIEFQFPSILLNIIPVPIENIEREGSHALLQNMKKDIVVGLSNFRRAFIVWTYDDFNK